MSTSKTRKRGRFLSLADKLANHKGHSWTRRKEAKMWTPSTTALAAAAALAMADPCVGFVPGAGMLKLGRPSINSNVASTRRAHTESRGILGARMQEVKLKDVWNRNAGFEVRFCSAGPCSQCCIHGEERILSC